MFHFPHGIGQENLECFQENPLNHTGLVVDIAREYQGRTFEFKDLAGYGLVGLLEACHRFDKSRGCQFSTFATPWIRKEILRAFKDEAMLVRVPAYLYVKSGKEARREIELTPQDQEYMAAARRIWGVAYLGITQGCERDGVTCSEAVLPDRLGQESREREETCESVRGEVALLDERERWIIDLLYYQDISLKQVSKTTGLPLYVVRDLKKRALQKLRDRLEL